MTKLTNEEVMTLTNRELVAQLDKLVEDFTCIEDNTAELLVSLVHRKKNEMMKQEEVQKGIASILMLLSKARGYKAALEMIAGVGSTEDVSAAREECKKIIKSVN